MIETGARGATAQQLRDVLHVQLPEAGLAAAVGGLAQSFAGRSRAGVTLREVDQAWLQNGRSVLAPYADTLAGSYGAPLAAIDFTDPAAAATTVNAWFGAHTHGKISQLLTADDLQNAVLVLTDAVYLDAQWAHGFDPKLTAPAPFDTASGGAVNVPTHAPSGGHDARLCIGHRLASRGAARTGATQLGDGRDRSRRSARLRVDPRR